MAKLITPGNVTALLSVLAILAGAFGKKPLEVFLNDPATTQAVMTVIGSLGTLAAGMMKGVKQ